MAPSATQEMISLSTTTSNNVLHITKDLTDLKSSVATNQERLGEVVTQIKLIDSNIKNYNDNQANCSRSFVTVMGSHPSWTGSPK